MKAPPMARGESAEGSPSQHGDRSQRAQKSQPTISKIDGGITETPDWPGGTNQLSVSDDTEMNAGQAFNPDKVE